MLFYSKIIPTFKPLTKNKNRLNSKPCKIQSMIFYIWTEFVSFSKKLKY